MNPLQQMVDELLAAGYSAEQIPEIIRNVAAQADVRRQQARQAGYTDVYLNQLSGPQLFGLDTTMPLLTGQNEQDRLERLATQAAQLQSARAATGLSMLNLGMNIAQQRRQAEQDPFRLGEHLLNESQLPAGSGNPIASLIGQGRYIEPRLPDPMQEPQWQTMYNRLFQFGTPEEGQYVPETGGVAGQADLDRMRSAYASNPETANRFFSMPEADRRRIFGPGGPMAPSFAQGGTLVSDEPIVGMGMMSGQPRFMMGEAGPEQAKFTPMRPRMLDMARNGGMYEMRTFQGGGTVQTNFTMPKSNPYWDTIAPGQMFSRRGQAALALMDNDFGPARKFYREMPASQVTAAVPSPVRQLVPPAVAPVTPAAGTTGATGLREASAIAVGRSLQNNPFAPPELVGALLAGKPVNPAWLTGRFWNNVDPLTRNLVLSVNQMFGFQPESVQASRAQYLFPGFRVGTIAA